MWRRPRRAAPCGVDVAAVAHGGRSATTSLPQRSLGRPATTQSYTPGWALIASSTSSAKIFSPPELIVTASRPCSSTHAVGAQAGPVARHRVAHAVDHRVRARRLVGVAEVAERQPAALGQPAELVVAGRAARGRGRRDSTWLPGRDRERARRRARRRSRRGRADRRPPTSRGRRRSSASAGGARNSSLQPADSGAPPDSSDVEARQVVVPAIRARRAAAGRRRRRR